MYLADETDPYLEEGLRALRQPTMGVARVPITPGGHVSSGEPAVLQAGERMIRTFVPRGPSLSKRISDARYWIALKSVALLFWAGITFATALVGWDAVDWAGILLAVQGGAWVALALGWMVVGDAFQLRELKARLIEEGDRMEAAKQR